jgi:hypothetical protein
MDKPRQDLGGAPATLAPKTTWTSPTPPLPSLLGMIKKTPFWHAPWLDGRKPIEIAPLVFAKSKRKNWKVHNALKDNAWVGKIELGMDFSFQHLSQFINLWGLLQEVHLVEDVDDSIVN